MKENKNLLENAGYISPLSLQDSSNMSASKASPQQRRVSAEVSREGTTILKTNLKNNSKLRPFNRIIGDVGKMQYFPA